MKFNLKNVFLSVGMFVFALALFTGKAEAATVTSASGGDWNAGLTWVGGNPPQTGDSVVIASGHLVTLSSTPVATSIVNLTINDGVSTTALTMSGASTTLTATGTVTVATPTGDSATTTLAVGNATLLAQNLAITGGAATRISQVTISTGTITTSAAITLAANAQSSLVSTGISHINVGTNLTLGAASVFNATNSLVAVGGDFTAGGTFTGTGSTITFNGTGAQAMGAYTTYNNVTIAGTGNTVTPTGSTVTIGGNLLVTTGTLDTSTYTFNVTGTTTVATTGTLSFTSGTKTFTGLVTLNSNTTLTGSTVNIGAGGLSVAAGTLATADSVLTVTGTTTIASGATINFLSATGLKTFTGNVSNVGTWTEGAVAVAITFAGNLANTGTFTATPNTTGVHTFSSATCALSGTLAIPSVSVSGVCSNSGTLTVLTLLTIAGTLNNSGTVTATTALSGAGTGFVNGATGILNIDGLSAITNLNVSTAGNTVNYRGTGQTINAALAGTPNTYSNLGLSGSGIKAATATSLAIGRTLTITAGTLSLATANTYTANKLYFGTAYQKKGTWGSTGSTSPVATHTNNTYFTTAADGMITIALGKTTSDSDEPITVTTTPDTTPDTTPVVPPAVTPGCSAGNLFNTSTGAACVNNETLQIPGCGNRATGFSTSTGASCVGNHVTTVTPPTTYNFGTAVLKNGSQGAAVIELQKFLNAKLNLGLVLDGKLGPKTIAVIKQWQAANGLVSDGLVGPMTKQMMNSQAQ